MALSTTGFPLIGYSLILIVWGFAFESVGFFILWLVIRGIRIDQQHEDEEVQALDQAEAADDARRSGRKAA
jgi:hypothetical protein